MRLETPTATVTGADADLRRSEGAPPPAIEVIAVTGSSGKSTVVTLLRAMLRAAGLRVWASLDAACDRAERLTARDRVVLDLGWPVPRHVEGLSMLVITGLSSDELAPGSTVAEAAEGMRRLARAADACVVVNGDDAQALSIALNARVPVRRTALADRTADATILDGEVVVTADGLSRRAGRIDETVFTAGALAGDLLVAATAALAAGARIADVRRAARHYVPPTDQFETLGSVCGVTWVCDAAATRPGRTAAMLDRVGSPVLLVAGGRYGGQPLRRWTHAATTHAAHVLLFGSAAPRLADALIAGGGLDRIVRCADLEDATMVARRLAVPGDTVIFSPGCAPDDGPPPGPRFRARALAMLPRQEAA
jgi:UDP-N-acetylmuramoylalanine--D-glutamate ligase